MLGERPILREILSSKDSFTLKEIIITRHPDGTYDVNASVDVKLFGITFSWPDDDRPLTPSTKADNPANINTGVKKPADGFTWIDIQKKINVVELSRIGFAIEGGHIDVGLDATLSISVFTAELYGFGISIPLADGSVDFRLSGLGISLNCSVIEGGGYLTKEDGRYFGVLQLKIMNIGVMAVALLDTKDASGKPLQQGYSLLLLVFFNLPPIQLGFGFVLTGVGGLLALHRRIDLDEFRSQMRSGALRYIMFPADPIAQAPAIEQSMSKIFPPTANVFVIAPMAQIGWGNPDPILKIDIGIMLELPSLNSIVLLGRMKLALPDEKDPIAVINLDSLGILRLDEGSLSIDAELYDSRIAMLTLSGEMALRLNWKRDKQFLFSMGGYHPAYKAPPSFPSLKRMVASLSIGDWFHLRLESYFALTSNTLQFGARLDLDATVGPIAGKGYLSFNALIYFNPFGLLVDIGAAISIEACGINLLAVAFEGHLAGPSPWHVWGKAKFHVLFVDLEFSLDARIGDSAPSSPPEMVNIQDAVLTEITRTSNWGALPPDGFGAVTLLTAKTEDGVILLHPLGSLRFSQKILPFNKELDKFGNALIKGRNLISVADVRLGDSPDPMKTSDLYEDFAPAQFLNLTETQKLTMPSFESHISGFEATDYQTVDFDGSSPETDFNFDTIYEDTIPGAASGSDGSVGSVSFVGSAGKLIYRLPKRREMIAGAPALRRELAIAAALGVSSRTGRTAKALRFAEPLL